MSAISLTRTELHRLVWLKPLNKLSDELGVAGAKLGKICDEHGIPRPPHGHWTLLEMGREVTITPLPTPEKGQLVGRKDHWSEPCLSEHPCRILRP